MIRFFGYSRHNGHEEIFVVLNMSEEVQECAAEVEGDVLCSTHELVEKRDDCLVLQPHQGVVLRRQLG